MTKEYIQALEKQVSDLKRNANSRMVFKLENELSEVKQKLVNGSRKNQIYFSIEELRHIFDAVEQHIYATEERIKDNHAFDQHSDTHICERNLGELNDLRGKILNNIKGGQNA